MFDFLSAGASLLGSAYQNWENKNLAEDNRSFQAEMSNTAYRRAVIDLKEAGLNPMLAYQHGGASTPSGSVLEAKDPITPAVNTGKDVATAKSTMAVQQAQVADINAAAGLKTAQTSESQAKTMEAEQNAALLATNNRLAEQNIVTSGTTASLNKAHETQIFEQMKLIAPQIKELVSRANLNDQQKIDLISKLPLIAAQTQQTSAETARTHQDRLLKQVEMQINVLKVPEHKAIADYYDSQYGKASPYINNATEALGNVTGALSPWALLFGLKGREQKRRRLNVSP
ncbi:MAG: DNA pilot protein [Microvirus sp.]|nr:MAG: DNA pilot protein [Microvirus sp.]